jgi:hypothetical protein
MFLQIIFAVAVYEFVIKGRGTPRSFLMGFGIIIPLALYTPFYLLEELNLQNKAVRLCLATLPTVVCFRCLEAMFKTPSDICVEVTLGNYMTYYSTLMSFEWSTKTLNRRRITTGEIINAISIVVHGFVRMSIFLSVMMHYDFKPFATSPVVLDDFHLSFSLLHPAHLANSYALGVLTYAYLSLGMNMTALADQTKGYYTQPIFRNPLVESRSISDFWGRRWNLVIHRMIKNGVMRPVHKYFSASFAIVVSFLASGLLHDFTWSIVFYHHSTDPCATQSASETSECFYPKPFKLTAFFLYCGACMLLERFLSPYFTFTKSLPTIIVAQFVFLTGCPVGHWYTGDWTTGGMFTDFATAVFLIRKVGG